LPRPHPFFTKQNLIAAGFLILLATLLWLLFSLLQPFLSAFVWALILSMVFYPLYSRLLRWTRGRATVASILGLLCVLVSLALPGFVVLANLGPEVGKIYGDLAKVDWPAKSQALVQSLDTVGLQDLMARWGVTPQDLERVVREGLASAVQGLNRFILSAVGSLLQNTAGFLAQCFFVLFCLFFFFRDGAAYADRVVEFLPLQAGHRDEIMGNLSRMVSSVVRAMFVGALAQGVLAGVGFAVAGVPLPILLGLATAVGSFVPVLGAAIVWIPVSVYLLLVHQTSAAVLLALWGLLAVGSIDNVLKPMIIGGGAKLPVLLIFFTTLGGIKLYGFLGVFLGPLILSLGLAFLAIYRGQYLDAAPVKAPPGGPGREKGPKTRGRLNP